MTHREADRTNVAHGPVLLAARTDSTGWLKLDDPS